MSTHDKQDHEHHRFVQAYDRMLERVKTGLEEFGKDAKHLEGGFKKVLSNAIEKAVELGELTREEANKIADYLVRDVQDASRFMADTGEEFRNWLRFDVDLVEDRVLDLFSRVADKTTLEQMAFYENLAQISGYRQGEIAGIGTLQCKACGATLHFHQITRIPSCPKCEGQLFVRIDGDQGQGDAGNT